MHYQVLARKWRPSTLQEVVGQDVVCRMLGRALEHKRLHHAYLFTGSRGVGKTSIARILAKCLQCERGVCATPCGVCSACESIAQGRFADLIEVDAASRTKVEDTRELLDNVPYAPTAGRYKIYLIDEVHMLSGHSFNALLKTLEEPPEHVVFLLATTDPHKLPETVISRCLQLHLRLVDEAAISSHLAQVLQSEQIVAEEEALVILARSAKGSLRDALSLLEQVIAFQSGGITRADVEHILGVAPSDLAQDLLRLVFRQDRLGLREQLEAWKSRGISYQALLESMLRELHRMNMGQLWPSSGEAASPLLDLGVDPLHVQSCYQMLMLGQRDLKYAPDPQLGFEMVLLRLLAFQPLFVDAPQPGAKGIKPPVQPVDASSVEASPAAEPDAKSNAVAAEPVQRQQPAQPSRAAEPSSPTVDWFEVVAQLGLDGLSASLAQHATVKECQLPRLVLTVAPGYRAMANDASKQRLQTALSQHFSTDVRLQLDFDEPKEATPAQRLAEERRQQLSQARDELAKTPMATGLAKMMGAQIDSVELLDDDV